MLFKGLGHGQVKPRATTFALHLATMTPPRSLLWGSVGFTVILDEMPLAACMQEVTHNILTLLSTKCPWWRRYTWSLPKSPCPYFTMLGCDLGAIEGHQSSKGDATPEVRLSHHD